MGVLIYSLDAEGKEVWRTLEVVSSPDRGSSWRGYESKFIHKFEYELDAWEKAVSPDVVKPCSEDLRDALMYGEHVFICAG